MAVSQSEHRDCHRHPADSQHHASPQLAFTHIGCCTSLWNGGFKKEEFNAACGDTAGFNPTELDGIATIGLSPPKTNWARPISVPPYYGYSLRPGVTFTYLGLKVDATARCSVDQRPIRNLWAAGETMAGSILGQGYLAGFGMTIGTVFGRIAGREAAAYAR